MEKDQKEDVHLEIGNGLKNPQLVAVEDQTCHQIYADMKAVSPYFSPEVFLLYELNA